MIPIFRLVIRTTILLCLGAELFAQHWVLQTSGTTASLRGISVVSDQVAWASGTSGTFLRTVDGGVTWSSSTVPGEEKLDFRGVQAFSERSAVLMASGEGELSAILVTGDAGAHWRTMLRNPDPKGFFDAIAFRDAEHGTIFGDPVNGKFVLLRTDDVSKTIGIGNFEAAKNEAAFAASNSALVMLGADAWIATGGPNGSRVGKFPSAELGCCKMVQVPIRHDADSAGIFGLAFADGRHGIAVGGDYSKPMDDAHNIAITEDGGLTWNEPPGTHPRGYRSAVVWIPQSKLWVTAGTSGSEISRDGGRTWIAIDEEPFNALAVSPGGDCWAVGPKGRIAKLIFDGPAKR